MKQDNLRVGDIIKLTAYTGIEVRTERMEKVLSIANIKYKEDLVMIQERIEDLSKFGNLDIEESFIDQPTQMGIKLVIIASYDHLYREVEKLASETAKALRSLKSVTPQPHHEELPLVPRSVKRNSMQAFVKNMLDDNDGLNTTTNNASKDPTSRRTKLLSDLHLDEHTIKIFLRMIHSITSDTLSGQSPRWYYCKR